MSEQPVTLTACIVTYRSNIVQVKAAAASLAETFPEGKLLIVDNDSGAEYLERLRAELTVPVIDSGANKGFGYGHNVGLRASSASYFHLVMNPDVVMHPDALAVMLARLRDNPAIALVVPKVLYPDGRLQPLNKRLPSVFDLFARRFLPLSLQRLGFIQRKMDRYMMLDAGYDKELDVPFASGCFMLFRRDMLERINGFDERYFMYLEDADICIRLRAAGGRVIYAPDAVITHHWARGSHHSWRLLVVMLRSMLHYFQTWGWKWW